jgi:voltage-gated potassium channel
MLSAKFRHELNRNGVEAEDRTLSRKHVFAQFYTRLKSSLSDSAKSALSGVEISTKAPQMLLDTRICLGLCRQNLGLHWPTIFELIGSMKETWKETLTRLYTGSSNQARQFRFALITFDALTIILFIITAPLPQTPTLKISVLLVGALILIDFSARLWISDDRGKTLRQAYTIADMIVIASLLVSPFINENIAFLRILRGLRLIHSYHLLHDLRRMSPFFSKHEYAVVAAVNLFVFVFFTTSVVFAIFTDKSNGFEGYVNALYFTVTTLTTTGYGDITPETTGAKLFAVLIMIVGVALFVQLARAIIQPAKVSYKCKNCGLLKHDPDAVHCKHCGAVVQIETQGLN